MTESGKRVAYAVGGAVGGALLVWGLSQFILAGDEDRPPIIVRNGSLVIESGNSARPGKNWKPIGNTKQWQPDHGGGKRVETFRVYFVGGTVGGGDLCRPALASDLTVKLDHDNDPSTAAQEFLVTRRADAGRPVPTVTGELTLDSAYPTRLTASTSNGGVISSIAVPDFECMKPLEVWIESVK